MPKIGCEIDIKGPKIGGPGLDIYRPKFNVCLDIHGPKIRFPNVDSDINPPNIGDGLDILGVK
jgi:hypothetical protein